MKANQKTIEAVANRPSRTTSMNKYSDLSNLRYALREQRNYSIVESKSYNEYQNFLYHRALYGIKVYSEEEQRLMYWQKRERIMKVHNRTQTLLNRIKQERVIDITNKIFEVFTHSTFAKNLISLHSKPELNYMCNTSFKDLGLSKDDLIKLMINEGVLPRNFYNLTIAPCEI